MSRAEHERAIASALAAGDRLQTLFEALGSKGHPTRGVWAAFGMARQTLRGYLGDLRLVNRTLAQLRETTLNAIEKQILSAVRTGERQAARELAIYDDLPTALLTNDAFDTLVAAAMVAVSADLDALLAQVRAMVMTGVEEQVILGDESGDRTGVLRPAGTVNVGAVWTASSAWGAYDRTVQQAVSESGDEARWMKQAIAAIDPRTTDCCLRVSGQTVPLKGKFRLTGTPRFANEMDGPPFHHFCRSATALVRAENADDDLTQRMQAAAQAEIDAKAAGDTRPYKFPVDAFGGRVGTNF